MTACGPRGSPRSPRAKSRGLLTTLALALAVVLAAGCSKCGAAKPATPVERLLPKGAAAVLVVPKVQALGDALVLLESFKAASFAAQLREFPSSKAFADALVGELGVDLRDPKALEQAGLDGTRALGAAVLITGQTLLVLPVKDEARFHHALETLSYRRLAAGAGGEQRMGAVVVKTFSPAAGKPPAVAYTLKDGWALVSEGTAAARLPAIAEQVEADALTTDAALTAALARVPADKQVWAWAPTGSPLLVKGPFTNALVTARLVPEALTLAADATWKPGPETLALFTPQPGAVELAGTLPPDAFLVARYSGDPTQLAPVVNDVLGPYLTRAFREGGFDPKSEILQNLAPGVILALSLADRPPMAAGMPALDIRQTNPFNYAHLSGAAQAKSPEAVPGTLDKVAALGPRFGAKLERIERQGAPTWATTWAQGEGVHFALKDGRLFFASPMQRLDALLSSDGKAASPVAGLGTTAVAAVLDVRKLAASVRALPESAWGLGGFAMKGATVRWLDAVDDLLAVSLSVGAKGQAVQATLTLSREPPKAAAAPAKEAGR